jgi:lysophospholipase L1-like esterase
MNCDTGRYITDTNGNQTFTISSEDAGTTFQNDSGQYLDLRGTSATLSSSAVYYTVTQAEFGRYQIKLANGNYVYDSDDGIDNTATLANTSNGSLINTAWFITPADERAPLRILTLGDSLTYGVDLELIGAEPRVAYRQTLSRNLIDYFGEVVFVGNVDKYTTTINDPYLYRHSGYSGYVIEDVYHVDQHPGIKPMVDEMMAKYKPDIVIMMLGTNDLGLALMVNDIIPRWESFVKQVEAQLPENGLLLCSALPPISTTPKEPTFNEKIQSKVHALANEGYKIGFVDPHTPMEPDEDSYLNSDGVHFNALGYNMIGRIFTEAITSAYTQSSEKVTPNPLIPVDPFAEPVESSSQSQPDNTPTPISPIVWVLVGLGTAIVVAIVVLILVLRKKK